MSVKGALLSVLAIDNAKDCMEDGWNFRGLWRWTESWPPYDSIFEAELSGCSTCDVCYSLMIWQNPPRPTAPKHIKITKKSRLKTWCDGVVTVLVLTQNKLWWQLVTCSWHLSGTSIHSKLCSQWVLKPQQQSVCNGTCANHKAFLGACYIVGCAVTDKKSMPNIWPTRCTWLRDDETQTSKWWFPEPKKP